MAANIADIPLAQLVDDRDASLADVVICELALSVGITHHRDGLPVAYQLEVNRQIVETIDRELARRAVAEFQL